MDPREEVPFGLVDPSDEWISRKRGKSWEVRKDAMRGDPGGPRYFLDPDPLVADLHPADAERIARALNAVKGLQTEDIPTGDELREALDAWRQVRAFAELLERARTITGKET